MTRLRFLPAVLLGLACLPAFAQMPPPGGPPPSGMRPPGAPPGPRPDGMPPPPPPPPQVVVVEVPVPAPAPAPVVVPTPAPVAPIGPMEPDATSEPDAGVADAGEGADAPEGASTPASPDQAEAPPSATVAQPGLVPPAGEQPKAEDRSLLPWVLVLLGVFGAGLLAQARSRRLQDEAQRLSQRERRLQTAHVQLRAESEQLRQLAINDPLTGTFNRLAFNQALRERLEYLARFGRPLDLVVFDLDHFKAINDREGHLAGDAALRFVAGVVREHLDSDDLFGRFGGDEFLIACADQGTEAVASIAEAIRRAVETRAPGLSPPLPGLSLSMGIAQANTTHGYDADDLFARADAALYRAKREGRNRVMVSDGDVPASDESLALHRHL
ncbi:GGDEF domain-containing protein [Lysobacter xanthus]